MLKLQAKELHSPLPQTAQGSKVSLQDVAKFAPVVQLYPGDAYLPCSIEYLLAGATLRDQTGKTLVERPRQKDLARYRAPEYVLHLDPTKQAGEGTNAPMYFAIQTSGDARFVDLTYICLFALNGPQTARVRLPYANFSCTLPDFAEHQGDLESLTVRVSADFEHLLGVRTEAHGHSTYLRPDAIEMEGSHPIVRCALNSHATYSGKGCQDDTVFVTQPFTAFGIGVDMVDVTSRRGPVWRAFEAPSCLRLVGLDDAGAPIGSQLWSAFAGHLGARRDNQFRGARGLGDKPLSHAQASYANWLAEAVIATGATKKYSHADGCRGLAQRLFIKAQSTWPWPEDAAPPRASGDATPTVKNSASALRHVA